jgi:hypothetical protein
MGYEIKRNRKGQYQVIADGGIKVHDKETLTPDEIKKMLIQDAYFKFIEKAIEIDMTFPHGYYVNDKRVIKEDIGEAYHKWKLDSFKGDWNKNTEEKFNEIKKRLEL